MTRRRVLLVDDHPIVREGVRRLLAAQPDLEACGEAETVADARRLLRELAPDVLVVDLSLRQGDGLELVKDVRAHHPGLPVLVLSMHDERIYAERVLAAGASGYLMKHAPGEQLLAALRRVLAGATWQNAAPGDPGPAAAPGQAAAAAPGPLAGLSDRELQVLGMLGRGLSTRQVAEALSLSVKTVESHRQRLRRKLGLGSGAQLVQFAINWVVGGEAGGGPPPV